MAHYKRGKSRAKGGSRISETTMRKRLGLKPVKIPDWRDMPPHNTIEYLRFCEGRRYYWPESHWFGRNWPRWHDIIYHNRPRRAKERAMARLVMLDHVDADEALWPLSRRPHQYYW